MLSLRGFDTVQVSKVKGHATHAMVDNGDVRLEDLVGNNGADAAADLGRLRQQERKWFENSKPKAEENSCS